MRIALVEDDPAQADLMRAWIEAAGHHCHLFATGRAALHAVARESFDLFIIDWNLPDVEGTAVLARLREDPSRNVPVLFVTSRTAEADIVRALEQGADDYMVKPVSRAESLARINALARRSQPLADADQRIDATPFSIDPATRAVSRDGAVVELTQKEFELTLFLFRNAGRLLSRGHILESVWGHRADLNTRTVDTHVSRIRTKLGLGPESGWRLGAVYQHGYRLERIDGSSHAP